MSENKERQPTIDAWQVIAANADPYRAPELTDVRFRGEVYNYSGIKDGKVMTIPAIKELYMIDDQLYMRDARGTAWVIGLPCPEYEEKFPSALARVKEAATNNK